jgi:Polyketide cyclase / dehydrase and lipid transport
MVEATMATFQNTVTIRRAIEDVFGFLADFENIPRWNCAILQTTKTSPGPVGVGTRYSQVRSLPSRREEGFEVTVFEPTSRLEVHGEVGPFTATISYLLAPLRDGTCLTNTVELQPASGALRLLAPLAASRVKTAVAANLDTLRQLLETEVGAAREPR